MKKIIHYAYSYADAFNYLFLGQRRELDRPLFLYPEPLRPFYKKYGQHGNHLCYKSTSPEAQFLFLKDYLRFLQHFHQFDLTRLQEETPTLYLENKRGKHQISFNQEGCPVYQSKAPSYSGHGYLSISFEINL